MELRDRGKALRDRFLAVCNKMNTALGDAPGSEVHAACNNIAARIAKANALAPTPDGGIKPVWVTVTLEAASCKVDTTAQAKCLDTCSGKTGCDSVKTCAKGGLTGTCPSECSGVCEVSGPSVACNGACAGQCAFPNPDGGPEGGVPACTGECRGTCAAANWTGRCTAGCTAGFAGQCQGTCTGSCDEVPYPPGQPDAGDGGDAGDAAADAAPPPGSGNCAGLCRGRCTGAASGSCTARCTGEFGGGVCGGAGGCIGVCNGANVPCVTTCAGACKSRASTCSGTCNGCSAEMQGATCVGQFDCGEANPICKGVCAVRGALAAKCGPVPVDIRLAGDVKLYDALKANAEEFSAIVRETSVINNNIAGALDQTTGKFRAAGVVYDNARLCASGAAPIYEEASALIREASSASAVLSGIKF